MLVPHKRIRDPKLWKLSRHLPLVFPALKSDRRWEGTVDWKTRRFPKQTEIK